MTLEIRFTIVTVTSVVELHTTVATVHQVVGLHEITVTANPVVLQLHTTFSYYCKASSGAPYNCKLSTSEISQNCCTAVELQSPQLLKFVFRLQISCLL